jgi:hypothetical protein
MSAAGAVGSGLKALSAAAADGYDNGAPSPLPTELGASGFSPSNEVEKEEVGEFEVYESERIGFRGKAAIAGAGKAR